MVAFEAFPGAGTDSGISAPVRLPQYDLCEEGTLLQLLIDVYSGRVTSIHFGTPCHSLSTFIQSVDQECVLNHSGGDRLRVQLKYGKQNDGSNRGFNEGAV